MLYHLNRTVLSNMMGDHTQTLIIGDVHAGRTFKTGIPLPRLGEREVSVIYNLRQALTPLSGLSARVKTHAILMGDVFDKFQVSNEVLWEVFKALNSASHELESIIVLQGNHDVSRDTYLVSSFQVLKMLCQVAPNITFVDGATPHIIQVDNKVHCFFGYNAFVSAKEMAENLPDFSDFSKFNEKTLVTAYGHWDITAYHTDFNLIPIEVFKPKGIHLCYTGHIHKKQTVAMQGINVYVVGSLQPYAHGEEGDDDSLYQTLFMAEVKETLEKDLAFFHNINLRVLLNEDDVWDVEALDCLSLVFKRVEGGKVVEDIDVGYADFSSEDILKKNLSECSEDLQQFIQTRLSHHRQEEVK